MADPPRIPGEDERTYVRSVGRRATRRLRARHDTAPGVWAGLGRMGLVGWSVAVPTLLGAGLGAWLDARSPGEHRWTLALLMAGLVLGCFNAWHWIAREDRAMREEADAADAAAAAETEAARARARRRDADLEDRDA
jgi:ATP synthase protein I